MQSIILCYTIYFIISLTPDYIITPSNPKNILHLVFFLFSSSLYSSFSFSLNYSSDNRHFIILSISYMLFSKFTLSRPIHFIYYRTSSKFIILLKSGPYILISIFYSYNIIFSFSSFKSIHGLQKSLIIYDIYI